MRFQRSIGYVLLAAAWSFGCSEDKLARELPELNVVPLPDEDQTELANPLGIDVGIAALYGGRYATFQLENPSRTELEITSVTITEQTGATFTIEPGFANLLTAGAVTSLADENHLRILFEPLDNNQVGQATIEIATNAGISGDAVTTIQVTGEGGPGGEPNLKVCFAGSCHPVDTSGCVDRGDGIDQCTTPALDFGNVATSSSATQEVTLLNDVSSALCVPPPVADPCSPVCRVTIEPDTRTGATGLGLGLVDTTQGFAIEGSTTLPLTLDTDRPSCGMTNRQRFFIRFDAGPTEEAMPRTSTLIVESNDPQTPDIRVPLTAHVRPGPIALPKLKPCNPAAPTEPCSIAEEIKPLDRVYLDGTDSYDPRDPGDPSLITAYEWTVIDWPDGINLSADPNIFDIQGENSSQFSMWLPLVGTYTVRLVVTNDLGLESGVTAESDLVIEALPNARFTIELRWDHPTNDMDLHFVHLGSNPNICGPDDCYWRDCAVDCLTDPFCTPQQWFGGNPFEGPNPRLDRDDQNGLGPETISIETPNVGTYQVYTHYYGFNEDPDSSTLNTVAIYLDGTLAFESSRILQKNQLWRVAEIEWNASDMGVVTPAVSDGAGDGSVVLMESCAPGGTNFSGGF